MVTFYKHKLIDLSHLNWNLILSIKRRKKIQKPILYETKNIITNLVKRKKLYTKNSLKTIHKPYPVKISLNKMLLFDEEYLKVKTKNVN